MKQFIEVMKQAAVNAVEAGKPMGLLFGTVTTKSPLKIQLMTGGAPLTKEFFLALDPVPAFQSGDILVLLREQGGQRFLILGKKGAL